MIGDLTLLTFAVDGQRTLGRLGDVQEPLQDVVTGRAAVNKEQVPVVEARLHEAPRVVDLLVQSNNGRHVVFTEVGDVGLRGVEGVPCNNTTTGVGGSL